MAKRSKLAKEGFGLRCPYCKSSLPFAVPFRKFFDKDGNYIKLTFGWEVRKATFEECQKCGKRWPIWADYEAVSSPDVSVVETSRSEEPIGNDIRRIENKTTATIQRTVRASREWACHIELDITHASLNSSEQKLAMKDVGLTSRVQKSLQERYNVSIGETRKFEEEVMITIPGNTSIEAVFVWKQIWQNGYVELGVGQARVPFKLRVGITFDLRQDMIRQ